MYKCQLQSEQMSLDEAEYADAGWENANGDDWEHEEEPPWPEADSRFFLQSFSKVSVRWQNKINEEEV